MTRGVLLLQDNAPVHMSQVAMTAATEGGFEVHPQLPYSPDMAPSGFYMFPKLKSNLRGRHFGSNECVIAAVNKYLEGQEKDFYLEGISKLEQRWTKCIAWKGNYIEMLSPDFLFLVWGLELSDFTSYIKMGFSVPGSPSS